VENEGGLAGRDVKGGGLYTREEKRQRRRRRRATGLAKGDLKSLAREWRKAT